MNTPRQHSKFSWMEVVFALAGVQLGFVIGLIFVLRR